MKLSKDIIVACAVLAAGMMIVAGVARVVGLVQKTHNRFERGSERLFLIDTEDCINLEGIMYCEVKK